MSVIPSKKRDKTADIQIKISQFLQNNLTTDSIFQYKQLMIILFGSHHQDSDQLKKQYLKIGECIKGEKQTLEIITKKIAFFHGFISNMARKNIVNDHLQLIIEEQLQNFVEKVLMKLFEESKKRESSISKIYSYIREIACSKEKNKKEEKSKINLQDCNDKKAIREISVKVLRPFCFYLLKLLKSVKMYRDLINGYAGDEESPFYWKIANWCHSLGQILKETIRLGHYFDDDFLGLELLVIYLISIDLTIYYDVLQSGIEKRGISLQHRNGQEIQSPQEKRMLIQLRELVTEANLAKQSLNQIYCNPKLKEWKKLFARSEFYKYEESQGIESSSENILKFIEKQQKMSKQSKLREQLTSSNRVSSSLCSRVKNTEKKCLVNTKEDLLLGNQLTKNTATLNKEKGQEQKLNLLEFLQNKRKQLEKFHFFPNQEADQKGVKLVDVPNQGDEKHVENLISKAHKITNVRKMRLMHLNNDKRQQQSAVNVDNFKKK